MNAKTVRIVKRGKGSALVGLICAVAAVLGLARPAVGLQSVTLAWDASTNVTVQGYHLYFGTSSGVYTAPIDVGTNLTAVVPALTEGRTYFFAVTSYGSDGMESTFSQQVTFLVPTGTNSSGGTPGNGSSPGTGTPNAGTLALSHNPTAGSPTTLSFQVTPGQNYNLQASQDLVTWTTIYVKTAVNATTVQFADTNAVNFSRRFYRLVLQ